MMAEKYFVKGDPSPNELRLGYSQTYGETCHSIFCTSTRIVCDNTRRMAMADAIAGEMMKRHRHTKNANTKIEADLELFAKLHMAVEEDVVKMESLASIQVDGSYMAGFINNFFPVLKDGASTRAINQRESDVSWISTVFESGQEMDTNTRHSRYALLNAYTNWADHGSYSRSSADRWMDAQNGGRANKKQEALQYLMA